MAFKTYTGISFFYMSIVTQLTKFGALLLSFLFLLSGSSILKPHLGHPFVHSSFVGNHFHGLGIWIYLPLKVSL